MTSRCPKCGREVSAGAFYCPGCGARRKPAGSASSAGVGAMAKSANVVPVSARVGGAPGAASGMGDRLPAKAEIRGVPEIAAVERSLAKALNLDLYGVGWNVPTSLCETGEEFYGALLEHEALSRVQWEDVLDRQLKEAEADASRGGGIWGVFLGGRGCLLNGWLYQRVFKLKSTEDALRDERVFPAMVGTAIHEKWGHGFLGATTALGREAGGLQLDRYRYARLFPKQIVNTPEGVLLAEKWSAVFAATRYADEGWATWVEQQAATLVDAGRPPKPPLTPDTFGSAAASEGLPKDTPVAARMLLDPAVPPAEAQQAMAWWEEAEGALEEAFAARWGQSPRYVVGFALCSLLAARFGRTCVPAALAIAYNVTYGIEGTSVSDLKSVVVRDASLNVNRRLAALAHLPVREGTEMTPDRLARLAHESMGYAVPRELQR